MFGPESCGGSDEGGARHSGMLQRAQTTATAQHIDCLKLIAISFKQILDKQIVNSSLQLGGACKQSVQLHELLENFCLPARVG